MRRSAGSMAPDAPNQPPNVALQARCAAPATSPLTPPAVLPLQPIRATLGGALQEFTTAREPKGEVCLVVEGCSSEGGGGFDGAGGSTGAVAATAEERLQLLLASGMSVSTAARQLSGEMQVSRSTLYRMARAMQEAAGQEAAAQEAVAQEAAGQQTAGQPPGQPPPE